MSDVFLDTNLLIYAIDKDQPVKRRRARQVLRRLNESGTGVISTQILQEFYVVATGKLGMEPARAKRLVRLLSKVALITVTPPLIENAIDVSVANQISFWDALVIAAARQAGCGEVWSEDLQDGQVIEGVKIANPLASTAS